MTTIWFVSLLFLSTIVLAALIHKKRRNSKQPPSPPGYPFIGNLLQLGELPHQDLWRLSKKYGPVMLLKLGRKPTVVISSAEAAKQVMKVHDIHCCSRPFTVGPSALSYDGLDIAFAPFNDYWKELRRMCVQEIFSAKRVHSMQPIKEEEVKKFIASFAESASTKTPVNVNAKFLSLNANVICRAALGVDVDGSVLMKNGGFEKLISDSFMFLGSFSATDFFPTGGWIVDWLSGLQGRREKSVKALDVFYEQMFDLHKEEKKDAAQEDFVDFLLKLAKEESVHGYGKLTRNHIKAILMNILLGAIHPSAIIMTWGFAELIKNPRVMKKVQSEIRNQMRNKSSAITLEDIDHMPYLNMVIRETFRIHPPGPLLLPREAMSEFEIDGYKIQPKTVIHVNVWAIGRDPKTWKDPETFYPERFMDSDIDLKGQSFELVPFGSGRRICPGIHMATTMVSFFMSNMLYEFDWELPQGVVADDIDMTESPGGLTLGTKQDIMLVPVKYVKQ